MKRNLPVVVLAIGIVAAAGCASPETLPASVFVTNESTIATVRIEVKLDGETIIGGDFPASGEEPPPFVRYDFEWTPGSHHLAATTDAAGGAQGSIELTLEGPSFTVLGFFYNRDQPATLFFDTGDTEPVFL